MKLFVFLLFVFGFLVSGANAQWDSTFFCQGDTLLKIKGISSYNGILYCGLTKSINSTSVNNIFKSTDGGINWTKIYTRTSEYLFVFGISSTGKIFIGTNINIFSSTDDGLTFEKENTGASVNLPTNSIAISGTYIFFGVTAKDIYFSSNNGSKWSNICPNGSSGNTYYALTINENFVFAGNSNGEIYKSTNLGSNWSLSVKLASKILSLAASGNNVYAGTLSNGVYVSTNKGSNWTQSTLNSETVYSLAAYENCIIAGTNNNIKRSTDKGANWIVRMDGINGVKTINAFYIYNTKVFAGSNGSGIYWSYTDWALPVVMKMFMSEVSGNGVRLRWETGEEINCAGFEVERKCGGGQYVKAGYVSAKGAGKYEFADKGLQAGRFAYRIKQIDNNGNFAYYELAGDVVIGVPESYVLWQNFPNPFNPVTKINFEVPQAERVSIKVFDVVGREVSMLADGEYNAGYYSLSFDASQLSSGIYFYRMTAGGFCAVKRMVVLK